MKQKRTPSPSRKRDKLRGTELLSSPILILSSPIKRNQIR